MFPCLPSPLCSIALCGLMLLKLHRVRSCVVGFGSWDTDNTWIIGSDVFIIHSERVNIWCEFLDVSESICKLRAASFHWLQWQPGLRLRLPFLERVLQWSIMSMGYWKWLVYVWWGARTDGIQQPQIPEQRKRGMGVSWSFVCAV